MFQRKFDNFAKHALGSHHSVTFTSNLSEKEIVKKILKLGVSGFLNYDNEPTQKGYWGEMTFAPGKKGYNDDRISGSPSYHTSVGCNSHMKNQNLWTFFPIHKKQLANLGYTEEHLVAWIKFLNGMRAGLKYYYFGEQAGDDKMKKNWNNQCLADNTNAYYWVFMPAHKKDGHWKRVYLQWVALRYLINTTKSSQGLVGQYGEKVRLGYDNIPRIAMMLHEDFKLSKVKSFLYAQLANPFYYYWGMNFSDRLEYAENKFDVSVNGAQLKRLLSEPNVSGSMNAMLAMSNTNKAVQDILGRPLKAAYDHKQLFALFQEGKYKEFIKAIDESYKPAKPKKAAATKKAAAKKAAPKKAATKRTRKVAVK